MRLSVLRTDPGYHFLAHKVQVYLDGKKVSNCVTADEEKGYVICWDVDENGRGRMNKQRTDLVQKTFHGKVEIHIPKEIVLNKP